MSLPTTLLCPTCQTHVSVVKTDYRGIQQPDPTKDGAHVYLIQAECTTCAIRIVTTHQEATYL